MLALLSLQGSLSSAPGTRTTSLFIKHPPKVSRNIILATTQPYLEREPSQVSWFPSRGCSQSTPPLSQTSLPSPKDLVRIIKQTHQAEMKQLRRPSQEKGSQPTWSWPSAGFKQRKALALARMTVNTADFMGVQPCSCLGPHAQKGPTFGLMLCCRHLEILNHF